MEEKLVVKGAMVQCDKGAVPSMLQKKIFVDMAWQHEAYLAGGVDMLQNIAADNPDVIASETLQAWENIASGDPALITAGNKELLRREQNYIIQDNYDLIGWVPGLSPAVSAMALAPFPEEGKTFWEHVPGGDLTQFDDRWDWIENDMYPAWTDIIDNDPARARELATEPLNDSVTKAWTDFVGDAYNEWTDED